MKRGFAACSENPTIFQVDLGWLEWLKWDSIVGGTLKATKVPVSRLGTREMGSWYRSNENC